MSSWLGIPKVNIPAQKGNLKFKSQPKRKILSLTKKKLIKPINDPKNRTSPMNKEYLPYAYDIYL